MNTKLAIICVVILAVVAIGYTYFLNQQANNRSKMLVESVKLETQQSAQKEKKLDACLEKVQTDSKEHWNKLCKKKGLEENCLQDLEIVKIEDKRKNDARDLCFRRYQ